MRQVSRQRCLPARRRTALSRLSVLAGVLAALVLTGCGGGSDGSTDSSASEGSSGKLPAVSGDSGSRPQVQGGKGKPPTGLVTDTLDEGDGKPVGKGDLLVAHYVGQTWQGKQFDSSWQRGQPAAFPIGIGQVIPGWDESLVGVKAGSRVELSIPPAKGYGAKGNPQAGIKGNDTLVFVIDVLASYDGKAAADGEPVPAESAGGDIPVAVSGEAPAAPKLTVDKGASAPKDVVTQTLTEGDGPPVRKGQLLVAQYEGITLESGKTFDSSWQRGQPAAFPIGIGQVIPGWDEALVGVKVGSRVLLSVPPAKGYGAEGNPQAGISGDDTLVFVVDVVGAH